MSDASPSPSAARLHAATEALYEAFAAPRPAKIEGCPCCTDPRNLDALLATPLRALTGDQLSRYVLGAFLTVGGKEDFRYLLPRIFDFSANDPGHLHDPETVLGKLALANWRSWSDTRQRAVEAFVDAWFETALARDLEEAATEDSWRLDQAESVLCGGARAGFPLEPWLLRLQEPDAAPVLEDLRARFPHDLSAFWEMAPEGLRELSMILTEARA
ncbi:MAG TPA: hypothetical protein VGC56_12545 [Allosphingosinicella sp.]|jgi:hypothetical protein